MGLSPSSPTPEFTDTTTVRGHTKPLSFQTMVRTRRFVVEDKSSPQTPDTRHQTLDSRLRLVGAEQVTIQRCRLASAATELEAEDKWLSDLPHLMFHMTGNCSVKRGVEHKKSGDRRNAKYILNKT